MKNKSSIGLLSILLVISFVTSLLISLSADTALAQTADHVVISEVFYDEASEADHHEFVELYNPTDHDINIENWKLEHYNQTGTLQWTVTINSGETIESHHFYLLGRYSPLDSADWGYSITPDLDYADPYSLQNGPGDYVVLRDNENENNYVDGVRWGAKDSGDDIPDDPPCDDVSAGKSIERKSGPTHDENQGNGYDTDNAANDFRTRDTPQPQNSESSQEPALPPGVDVSISPEFKADENAENLTYTVTVKNTGSLSATYNIENTAENENWSCSLSDNSLSVAGLSENTTTLTVTIPAGAQPGDSTVVTVTATDNENASITDNDDCMAMCISANHVVISEVFYDENGVDNHEFVELYNPTDHDIDIENWELTHYNQTGTPQWTVTIYPGETIESHHFYLLGRYSPLDSADWGYSIIPDLDYTNSYSLQNGPGDFVILWDNENENNYVDGVRWGAKVSGDDIPDDPPYDDVSAGKSIERKSGPTHDENQGNGYDTDNAANDFRTRDTPQPQNSESSQEPALPPGVDVSISPEFKADENGKNLTYTVIVKNTGTENATFNIENTPENENWSCSLSDNSLSVAGLSENTTTLTVTIPAGAQPGDSTVVTVTATDNENASITDNDDCMAMCISANHVVISEVFYDEASEADHHEFVELYNPTDHEIDIENWELTHYNQTGTPQWTVTIGAGTTIPSHCFYLLGRYSPLDSADWGYSITPDLDYADPYSLQNGPGDYVVLRDNENENNYVDGVRWGAKDSGDDIPDDPPCDDVSAGKSIERKSGPTHDENQGNGYDTDNAANDFRTRDTPQPQNSDNFETPPT